jgi:hypothetical protein
MIPPLPPRRSAFSFLTVNVTNHVCNFCTYVGSPLFHAPIIRLIGINLSYGHKVVIVNGQGGGENMFVWHVYVVGFMALLLLCILGLLQWSGYRGGFMTGMMMTMSLGMVFGLAAGSFVGLALHGELLLSTLIGMLASSIIGFICGLYHHHLAGVEGLFSGLMAGMMGAMVTEMLSIAEAAVFLFICIMLLTCTIMFCIRHILLHTWSALLKKYDYLLLCCVCLVLLTAFLTFPFAEIENVYRQQPEVPRH